MSGRPETALLWNERRDSRSRLCRLACRKPLSRAIRVKRQACLLLCTPTHLRCTTNLHKSGFNNERITTRRGRKAAQQEPFRADRPRTLHANSFCHSAAGCRRAARCCGLDRARRARRRRAAHLRRLRAGVGRLFAWALRRTAARLLHVRLHGYARLLALQSLLLRRRVRPGRRDLRQDHAVRPVRDAPAHGSTRGSRRPLRGLAHGAPPRRTGRRARRARAARGDAALLRPHVHQRQGYALRGGDGIPGLRDRAQLRGISAAAHPDDPAVRPRARARGRHARHRRHRTRVRGGGRSGPVRDRLARTRREDRGLAGRDLRRLARARATARLCGDGDRLAVVGAGAAQSATRYRILLALLGEALEGSVRRLADPDYRHAAHLCAAAMPAEVAGDFRGAGAGGNRGRQRCRVAWRRRAVAARIACASDLGRDAADPDRGRHASGAL